MKKITLNESELRQLIQNSIKRVIKENEQEKHNMEYMNYDDYCFEDDEIEFYPDAKLNTERFEDTGEIYKIPEAKIVIEKVPEFEDLGPQKYIFFMGHTLTLINFETLLYNICSCELNQYPLKDRVFKRWLNSLSHEQAIEAFKDAIQD